MLLFIQFLYNLGSLKCPSVSSNNIQILPPFHYITSTSFYIQFWQNGPLIFRKWVFFTKIENSLFILPKESTSNRINILIVNNGCMSVPRLIHFCHFFYGMSRAMVDKGICCDFCKRVVDSTGNKVSFLINLDHVAKIIRPEIHWNG